MASSLPKGYQKKCAGFAVYGVRNVSSQTGERLGGGFRWRGVGDEVVPWRSRLSGEKAVRELGYRPLVTYEEALAETERHLTESGLIKR